VTDIDIFSSISSLYDMISICVRFFGTQQQAQERILQKHEEDSLNVFFRERFVHQILYDVWTGSE
jgi:hypothetical protein